MNSEHAPLPPSGAPQWGYCSGSVAANMHAPNFDSEPAREGTAAHWVGAECLEKWKAPGEGAALCSDWLGQTAPNGVVIDEKMVEGAQAWVSDVLNVCNQHGGLRSLLIEHRVHMPHIHADNWGTLDTALWVEGANTLYIWDYKHGHRENSARENLQLIDYVAGLCAELAMHADTTVVMRIVQPYCYKSMGAVDEWSIPLGALQPYFEQLRVQAVEALTNPTMTAGKHCRDCAAVARCATAKRASYSVISYAKEPYEINTLTGEDLAAERRILKEGASIVKARLDAIDDDLLDRVSKGDTTTGFAVQAGQGRLAWGVPIEQVIALAQQFGVDAAKPDVLTPTQTKNKVPAKMRKAFEGVIKSVTTRPSTGMKLIDATDSISARAFAKRK